MNHLHETIIKTKTYWTTPKKSLFHNTISLITSQQISFQKGREIRQKIYAKINSFEITHENLKKLSRDDFMNYGIDEKRVNTITELLKIKNLTIEKISKLKGIGSWTIKSLKILNDEPNILLSEDYWIRKQMSKLINLPKVATIKEIENQTKNYEHDKSELTKFLWRIKDTGIDKIKENKELLREDFL